MSKYIIKNCDNYTNLDENRTCCLTIQNRKGCYCCQDITDCQLKQIVELCKETSRYYSECIQKNRETNYQFQDEENMTWLMGRSHFADEILRLLDIEECENE